MSPSPPRLEQTANGAVQKAVIALSQYLAMTHTAWIMPGM